MKYALVLILLGLLFVPSPAKATCNCAEYNHITMYCLELGCSGHRTVLDCGGLYHDSCISCYGGVNPIPCCPNAPVYGAQIGGNCTIVEANKKERPQLYVRAFATSCTGTLVRLTIHLPKALMER
jgi:hypothetical protein